MNITLLGILAGLILLALPLYVLREFRVPIVGLAVRTFGQMTAVLAVVGACLYLLFRWNHWAVNAVCVLLMMAAGVLLTMRRARLLRFAKNAAAGPSAGMKWLVPVGAGFLFAVLVVGAWTLLLTLGVRRPLEARFLIPVAALLAGSVAGTLPQALNTYYAGLQHHGQLYYYMLGNGHSHGEALSWFVRRALERAVLPHLSQMSVLLLAASPLAVWAMLLAGASVVEAVLVQLLLQVAMFSASVVAIVVTLFVARRYAFDAYMRMEGLKG